MEIVLPHLPRSIHLNETAASREKLLICNKWDAGVSFFLISDCQVQLHLHFWSLLEMWTLGGKLRFVIKGHKRPGAALFQNPTVGADVGGGS